LQSDVKNELRNRINKVSANSRNDAGQHHPGKQPPPPVETAEIDEDQGDAVSENESGNDNKDGDEQTNAVHAASVVNSPTRSESSSSDSTAYYSNGKMSRGDADFMMDLHGNNIDSDVLSQNNPPPSGMPFLWSKRAHFGIPFHEDRQQEKQNISTSPFRNSSDNSSFSSNFVNDQVVNSPVSPMRFDYPGQGNSSPGRLSPDGDSNISVQQFTSNYKPSEKDITKTPFDFITSNSNF
jgi:hypothetical protein